ncbi:GNAT family N-acetyltransferase [Proteiniclasticum ruminis]|uniref:GNAT family N-acetyltransferase n=1 Tax=Proteiniclasticum ruminis TaxID=398199 RepID=UPI0015A59759|nr:GNAT family N-acetyltransferase [Proteiniclasticum ruminis]
MHKINFGKGRTIKELMYKNLFRKTIKVWVETTGDSIYSKISIDDRVVSKIQCVLQEEGILLIGDITPFIKKSYRCKGYGSLMMDELFKYAYENEINKIVGNLSLVDSDHKERLKAFYEKNGFRVIEYELPTEGHYGEIIKIM